MSALAGSAAIVGIGATEFSKNSGRSELRLACEAVLAALNDAGIDPADVDGIATFTLDNNSEIDVFRNIGGRELRFFGRSNYGGGNAYGPIFQAAMAVATGVAETVVCYRAMNERSQYRFGTGPADAFSAGQPTSETSAYALSLSQGLLTAAAQLAIPVRRYMHLSGATSQDFARYSVAVRAYAATNPRAFFHGRPITMEDHQQSRMIADPFRLLDCCQESDGGVAVVVTGIERARDLRQRPAIIRAAAQGAPPDQALMTSYYGRDIEWPEEIVMVGRQLFAQSGLTAVDMDLAIIYDHFGPTVLMQLEALGYCGRGEARHFLADGHIEPGGLLPVNTHGGQLGEAYVHGMNGLMEAVRQLRGDAVNQVTGASHVIVTGAMGVPGSGLVLGKD